MSKRLLLLIALVALGSCEWPGKRVENRTVRGADPMSMHDDGQMSHSMNPGMNGGSGQPGDGSYMPNDGSYDYYTPQPPEWLALDYACSGTLRRAQWLICEHDHLGLLHRRLALQWEAARRNASPERLDVLAAQQAAFLRERNACETEACVATAYHRYLGGEPRYAYDDGAYDPDHGKPRYAPKYHPRKYLDVRKIGYDPRGHDRGYGHGDLLRDLDEHRGHEKSRYRQDDGHGDEPGSCLADIGFPGASQLARQCDQLTPGLSSLCSVHNSCAGIKQQIARACDDRSRPRGYCANR